MKRWREESGHDYATYRFGYCEWAELEEGDSAAELYEHGYLPYSADPAIRGRFYLARSARLPLARFQFSSENRRIAKRFDSVFERHVVSPTDALAHSSVRTLFLDYFKERHGAHVMLGGRLDAILASALPLSIIEYYRGEQLVAAVIEVGDEHFAHFWFSAYDLAYVEQSLGMWLMQDNALRAKEMGRAQYYIGTVYGAKVLYKTNLEPLEYWNGSVWSDDLGALKTLARNESQ